jgi:hypothetical protein
MKHYSTKCGWATFLIVALICGSYNSYAQSPIGVQAGMNFSNVRITDQHGKHANTQSIPRIRIGLTADFRMAGNLYVQPAIIYSEKGFKQESGGYNGSANNFRVKATYLELPITLIYKPQFGNLGFLIGAGLYGAYGTGGNWKSNSGVLIDDMQIGSEGDVIFRNDGFEGGSLESYTYGRPIDYGAIFLLGHQIMRQLSVQVQAQVGLANLTPAYGDFQPEDKLKNSNIAVSLGYSF